MKNLLIGAALAAALALPSAAPAQRNNQARNAAPASLILVVDSDRAMTECNACRAATQQLQIQGQQLELRAQQLGIARSSPNQPTALETEEQQIATALRAARGNPSAQLQQQAQAFETRVQQARAQFEQGQQVLRSTAAHVQQQIGSRIVAISEQIRAQRGAAIVIAENSILAHNPAADITTEVLAQLNAQLPSVSVTPMPQPQAQPAQPGQPQPTQPQPQPQQPQTGR